LRRVSFSPLRISVELQQHMPGLPCVRVRARVGVVACVVCPVLVLGNMGIP
jgi:hypothetical protein